MRSTRLNLHSTYYNTFISNCLLLGCGLFGFEKPFCHFGLTTFWRQARKAKRAENKRKGKGKGKGKAQGKCKGRGGRRGSGGGRGSGAARAPGRGKLPFKRKRPPPVKSELGEDEEDEHEKYECDNPNEQEEPRDEPMGSNDQGSEEDNNDANSQNKEAEAGDEPMASSLHNDDDVADSELDVGPQQGPAVRDDHCSPEESQSAAAGCRAGMGSEIRNADPAQVASSESEDFEGQADNFRRPEIAEWVQNVLLDQGGSDHDSSEEDDQGQAVAGQAAAAAAPPPPEPQAPAEAEAAPRACGPRVHSTPEILQRLEPCSTFKLRLNFGDHRFTVETMAKEKDPRWIDKFGQRSFSKGFKLTRDWQPALRAVHEHMWQK